MALRMSRHAGRSHADSFLPPAAWHARHRGDAARNQWTFGIAGLPLRVRAGTVPAPGSVPDDLLTIWTVTPRIDISDGSVHRTAWANASTPHEVFTPDAIKRWNKLTNEEYWELQPGQSPWEP